MTDALHLITDGAGWSIDDDTSELEVICQKLEIPVTRQSAPNPFSERRFFVDRFKFFRARWYRLLGSNLVNYYHGLPGVNQKFDDWLDELVRRERFLSRIRVSTLAMESVLSERGLQNKVVRIPIPVNCHRFGPASNVEREGIRKRLGIPSSAIVVGSFQKDGLGWGEGFEAKVEKGPDILVAAIESLHRKVDGLYVLLAGPARGYVARELSIREIPFVSMGFVPANRLPSLYHALDVYLVSSRDEGGPKGVLEAMASGVPVASTPVGQAVDFDLGGTATGLSQSFDPIELADIALERIQSSAKECLASRQFAKTQTLETQVSEWAKLLDLTPQKAL